MESDEVRSLYVPMRLLRLEFQIDRIRQPSVKEINHLRSDFRGEVILGFCHKSADEKFNRYCVFII